MNLKEKSERPFRRVGDPTLWGEAGGEGMSAQEEQGTRGEGEVLGKRGCGAHGWVPG